MADNQIQTLTARTGSTPAAFGPGTTTIYIAPSSPNNRVASISVVAGGAVGGAGHYGPAAGKGGAVTATIPVTSDWGPPPYQMQLHVGAPGASGDNGGAGGFPNGGSGGHAHHDGNGGGGGGRSDIQLMPSGQPGKYIIFAGGGGGSGTSCNGGTGGTGGNGGQSATTGGNGVNKGGGTTCNGGGGAVGAEPGSGGYGPSSTGNPGAGPSGGSGGAGSGTAWNKGLAGGGGGGGYAGGGGGGGLDQGGATPAPDGGGGGGGGGSSYVPVLDPSNPPTGIAFQDGTVNGPGFINIQVNEVPNN